MTDLPKLLAALASSDDPEVRAWVPELWRGCDHFAAVAAATTRYLYGYDEGRVHAQRPESEAEAICLRHWTDKLDACGINVVLDRDAWTCTLAGWRSGERIPDAWRNARDALFASPDAVLTHPTRLAATAAAVVAVTGVEVA